MIDKDKVRIDSFVRRFDLALASMPADQRGEIVAELRSHLTERAQMGEANLDAAIRNLGNPLDYAQPFLATYELTAAFNRASPVSLLLAILARGTRSATALLVGFSSVLLFCLALSLVGIAVLKPVSPQHVGLWYAGNAIEFGFIAAPGNVPDLLGFWIVPLSLLGAAGCYLAGRMLTRGGGRMLLHRSESNSRFGGGIS